MSPSPSAGYSQYTRQNITPLPGNDNDLATVYTTQDEADVATKNDVRVAITGPTGFNIHLFKDFMGGLTGCQLECELQSTLAPTASTVRLAIYNRTTTLWDIVDFDNTSPANTDFTLLFIVNDLTNYKDASNVIACRVYQEIP